MLDLAGLVRSHSIDRNAACWTSVLVRLVVVDEVALVEQPGRGVVRCHRLEYHCGNTRKFALQDLAFGKTTSLTHDEAIAHVTAEVTKEGFGVLTEVDVAATMKKKLGLEMPPYRILGACNSQFAHRAIEAEPQIGARLPCNVVVRIDGTGATLVEVMDPGAVLGLVGRPEIAPIAAEVRSRLERVLRGV